MSNPFLQPVDINTGQLITTSDPANQFTAPYVPPTGQTSGGGFLGGDGYLSKLGETAVDLFGLWGSYEVKKAEIGAAKDRNDPVLEASQARAGFFPGIVQDYSVPLYIVGGIAVVGVLAAITIAATRK